jgi:hypothetical protein
VAAIYDVPFIIRLPFILSEPVTSVFEFIVTRVPESEIFELSMWSPPTDFGILLVIKVGSSPSEPVFLGPAINIPPEYDEPLAF